MIDDTLTVTFEVVMEYSSADDNKPLNLCRDLTQQSLFQAIENARQDSALTPDDICAYGVTVEIKRIERHPIDEVTEMISESALHDPASYPVELFRYMDTQPCHTLHNFADVEAYDGEIGKDKLKLKIRSCLAGGTHSYCFLVKGDLSYYIMTPNNRRPMAELRAFLTGENQ